MLGNVDHFELGADGLSITALTGWALDPETPDTPVEVLASVNGIPWGVGTASLFRADLIPIGRAGQLAFRIPLRMPLAITAGLLDGEGLRVVASSCPERPPQWLPLSGQYFLEPLRKIRDAESPATGSVAVFTMVYNEPRNLPLWTRYYGARRPLQSDTEVGYPSTGGFETLFQRLAAVTPGIEVDKRVERIDPVARTAWTSDGTAYHWRRLVSTIPLDQLVERVDGFPTELREEVRSLAYMSLDLLLLRTSIALPDAPQRIYFADPSVPPTRWRSTTPPRCNSAAGPATRSWPRSPTRPPNRSSPPDVAEVDTVAALVHAGVLPSAEVVAEVRHLDIRHAYPVYTHERPAILERVRRHLATFDIHTAGRFGEWEYINSDECLRKGRDLGLRLRSNKPR